jgi:Flp pilus assembly pilin Flp
MAEYVIIAAVLIAVSIGVLGLFRKTLSGMFDRTAQARCGAAGMYP